MERLDSDNQWEDWMMMIHMEVWEDWTVIISGKIRGWLSIGRLGNNNLLNNLKTIISGKIDR